MLHLLEERGLIVKKKDKCSFIMLRDLIHGLFEKKGESAQQHVE